MSDEEPELTQRAMQATDAWSHLKAMAARLKGLFADIHDDDLDKALKCAVEMMTATLELAHLNEVRARRGDNVAKH